MKKARISVSAFVVAAAAAASAEAALEAHAEMFLSYNGSNYEVGAECVAWITDPGDALIYTNLSSHCEFHQTGSGMIWEDDDGDHPAIRDTIYLSTGTYTGYEWEGFAMSGMSLLNGGSGTQQWAPSYDECYIVPWIGCF